MEISQKKWSRREEVDFFRTVAVFGVEYDKNRKQYDWTKFRSLSRLDKKTDESMTEYYNAFYTMLKRSCGLRILEEEGWLVFRISIYDFICTLSLSLVMSKHFFCFQIRMSRCIYRAFK